MNVYIQSGPLAFCDQKSVSDKLTRYLFSSVIDNPLPNRVGKKAGGKPRKCRERSRRKRKWSEIEKERKKGGGVGWEIRSERIS